MRDNINKVSQRGERLDALQDKTDNLAVSAQGFRRGANRVRKQMWWKDMKMRMCLIVGIILLLVVIIVPVGKFACSAMTITESIKSNRKPQLSPPSNTSAALGTWSWRYTRRNFTTSKIASYDHGIGTFGHRAIIATEYDLSTTEFVHVSPAMLCRSLCSWDTLQMTHSRVLS